jgi:hypothetical protein
MDTHPPALASTIVGSNMRVAPILTLPSGLVIPAAPTPPPSHQSSQVHASGQQIMHPSSGYYGFSNNYSQVAPPPVQPAPTPWWVWMVGGTIAVALGVGAAVWYAGRGTEPNGADPQPIVAIEPAKPTPPPKPVSATTQPIDPAVKPTQPAELIEVEFDSLPSGAVFADGHAAELCRTPCRYNIDLRDGGAADKRTFIVKADGYRDGQLVVDLTGTQRKFGTTLEQLVVSVPVPAEKPGKKTGKKSTKTATTVTHTDPDHLIKPDPDDDAGSTTIKKPDEPKKRPDGTKIDPTDTLDPFHRKRP